MKKTNRILAALLCIFALAALSVPAFAADMADMNFESNLNIQYKYNNKAISGAKFNLYFIAERNGAYDFALTEAFSSSAVSLKYENQDGWNEAALALKGYALKNNIEPIQTGTTDKYGKLSFDGLKQGLYLVSGQKHISENSTYTCAPFVIALPELNKDGSYKFDVKAKPKTVNEEISSEYVDIRVIKVWDDEGSEALRPDRIMVTLMRNGNEYDWLFLTADNNWKHTWKKLDAEAEWTVSETVPEGYTCKLEQIGNTFKLTNTKTGSYPEPTPTPTPHEEILPQTGQLWWPVPVLLCAGLLCLVIGITRRKSNE